MPNSMSASVRCSAEETNTTHFIECLEDGQWNLSAINMCSSLNKSHTITGTAEICLLDE